MAPGNVGPRLPTTPLDSSFRWKDEFGENRSDGSGDHSRTNDDLGVGCRMGANDSVH